MNNFTATSDASYDRHNYRLVLQNGQSIIYGSWEEVWLMWGRGSATTFSHIEVLDKPQPKTKAKGF